MNRHTLETRLSRIRARMENPELASWEWSALFQQLFSYGQLWNAAYGKKDNTL